MFLCAAKSLVSESNQDPLNYYKNNVGRTANLLKVALENGWTKFAFSSTTAIRGNPIAEPINEDYPKRVSIYTEKQSLQWGSYWKTPLNRKFLVPSA